MDGGPRIRGRVLCTSLQTQLSNTPSPDLLHRTPRPKCSFLRLTSLSLLNFSLFLWVMRFLGGGNPSWTTGLESTVELVTILLTWVRRIRSGLVYALGCLGMWSLTPRFYAKRHFSLQFVLLRGNHGSLKCLYLVRSPFQKGPGTRVRCDVTDRDAHFW